MKITENFKEKLRLAKDDGYKNVYCVVGAYMATTYCVFHKIDDLLKDPIGEDYGNQSPYQCAGMWTGHANTRSVDSQDIMYSKVFKLKKDEK